MKKNIITLIILFLCKFSFAQDSIIKSDGSELNVQVTEVTDEVIKYKKKGLSVDFSISLDDVLVVTFSNGERMTFTGSKSKKNNTEGILLSAGTRIQVEMTETISSDDKGGRKVETGEVISLKVKADVTDIDGNILVSQGTLVNGTITEAEKRKAAGTKGQLGFTVEFIKAVDGQSVPVNLKYDFSGKSRTGAVIAAGAVVAAPLLLIKGKPAVIQEGTVFQALTVGDKRIKVQ